MTGMNLVPLPFPFELGTWGQFYLILLYIGIKQMKFHHLRQYNTVLAAKIIKEPRSHLPDPLSDVCKDNQTLLKGGKKGGH
jgi:hypothetical protein